MCNVYHVTLYRPTCREEELQNAVSTSICTNYLLIFCPMLYVLIGFILLLWFIVSYTCSLFPVFPLSLTTLSFFIRQKLSSCSVNALLGCDVVWSSVL
jgi:hypothetical protein